MARWKQVWNKELGKSEFIPVDEAAARRDSGIAIHGPIESFVSPIDGSVISDRSQLREHNRKHNVVNTQEFSPEYLAKKRAETERIERGEHTAQETFARKQYLNEVINQIERRGR